MRRYIVTGGSSGLGAAIVSALLEYPDTFVYVMDQRVAHRLRASLGLTLRQRMHYHCCDLSSENAINNVARDIIHPEAGTLRGIDCLINCAGICHIDYSTKVDASAWDHVMAINARAPFLLTNAILPALKFASGTVLNISSDAAHRPMTASAVYCASKAALEMETKVMAREFWRLHQNITVFGIAPAKLAGTDMSKEVDRRVAEVRGWTEEGVQETHRSNVMMKKDIPLDTIAEFIAFILSLKERHQYFHGQIIPYGG